MKRVRTLAFAFFAVAACGGASNEAVPPPPPPARPLILPTGTAASAAPPPAAPTVDEARAFVAEVEEHLRRLWTARDRALWVNETFITDDTEALSAAGEEATAAYIGDAIQRSRRFDAVRAELPFDVARKLYLLSIAQTVPAPSDPTRRGELADIESWMTSAYGKGQYCPPDGSSLLKYLKTDKTEKGKKTEPCLHLGDLSAVLAKSRKLDELVEAWRGWHAIAAPIRSRYTRYVQLANEGAREAGFADVGALWRSGYDMPPADLEVDVERLWNEVKPLYDELHCYVRSKLQDKYGKAAVPDHAPIPAELLGNMWAQEWNNIYDVVVPYPHDSPPDVGKRLVSEHWDAKKMVRQAEHFFTGLGFDPLPETFWQRSLFTRPRDREVVCHASAWDVGWNGDLRVKMCIEPTEEDLVTIHHELGHDFYFQRYGKLPILFQRGANDGFHEAIGDTIALSVTPEYLESAMGRTKLIAGVADGERTRFVADEAASQPVAKDEHARIDRQLKMALDKVAFLPFGVLIDKWRWDVFAGKIAPGDFEKSWVAMQNKYQGVAAPIARSEDDFDPGAKYHVASSAQYVMYFLARIYQFQFHAALCKAAGFTGPLDRCSIHDNKAAGARLMNVLGMGGGRPWPDAMEAMGAGRKADAGPLLEYFAPLRAWLHQQNKGQQCGW